MRVHFAVTVNILVAGNKGDVLIVNKAVPVQIGFGQLLRREGHFLVHDINKFFGHVNIDPVLDAVLVHISEHIVIQPFEEQGDVFQVNHLVTVDIRVLELLFGKVKQTHLLDVAHDFVHGISVYHPVSVCVDKAVQIGQVHFHVPLVNHAVIIQVLIDYFARPDRLHVKDQVKDGVQTVDIFLINARVFVDVDQIKVLNGIFQDFQLVLRDFVIGVKIKLVYL